MRSTEKKTLRRSGFKEPVQMIFIMMLFIIGVVTFPTRRIVEFFYKGSDNFFLLLDGVERLLFSIMMLSFVKSLGFRIIPPKTHIIDVVVLIPAYVIAINNFPFVSIITGAGKLGSDPFSYVAFAVNCLGIGFFEEVSFRGVILPLVYIKVRGKKRPMLLTLIISSAIFSLTHLVNLLNGDIGGTLFQVLYTFLIGAMCGLVTLRTGNVLLSAAVHIVYNFGGMILDYCGSGEIWPWSQIIFTAILGTVLGVYLLFVALKLEGKRQVADDMLGTLPTE